MFELPTQHYREAAMHEAAVVACILIDRRQARKLKATPEDFMDPFWRELLVQLRDDPWISLGKLVSSCSEPFAVRTIADAIRCPIRGWEKVFVWNFEWHQHEVLRLSRIRQDFESSLKFVLQHADSTDAKQALVGMPAAAERASRP